MKILFIIRASATKNSGGDVIQANGTAKYLRLLGADVDIRYSNETIDYSAYDILHFFNIIRPADILVHMHRSKKVFVVSTIYVDMSEYEQKVRKGISSYVSRILPADTTEYLKVIARSIINREKISSVSYLFFGQKQSIKLVANKAACLLPNSVSEYSRLQKKYSLDVNYKIIPNGIDEEIFKKESLGTKDQDLIICVGRIEPLKNQLKVIKALNNTKFRLIIIGAASTNEVEYYNQCKNCAAANVSFLTNMTQQELISYYRKAKVHVLASWFETTGLTSLEAASQHCNIVITDKGDAKEYFGEYAFYCDPASESSILDAVKKAASGNFDERLHSKIYSQYTWRQAAQKTLNAYAEILNLD